MDTQSKDITKSLLGAVDFISDTIGAGCDRVVQGL